MEKNKKRRVIVAVLVLLAVLAAGSTGLAEFIKSSRAKRVIAAVGNAGELFSSNYLVLNTNPALNIYRRIFYANDPSQPVSGDVSICNYAQGNLSQVYESDITYTLTARLVMLGESGGVYTKTDATSADVGAHTVKISLNGGTEITLSGSNLSHTFASSTLDHRNASTDICSLEFDSNFKDAGALCLYLCATPAGSGLPTLDAVFGVALSSGETQNLWEGEFNEKTDTGVPAQPSYDGFNYVISGVGRGTCVLTWNNQKLQISQVFLTANSLTPTVSGNQTSVTFSVDSDVISRYDLQFYYADESVSFASWAELTGSGAQAGYVQLTYTEAGEGE